MAMTVLQSLNQALHQMMKVDERVVVLGEDLLDPYGGAFKVTKGLSTSYPKRVWTTPISEAGFVGVAVGMSLRGMRPVVEIMFGDFLALAADQLINHAAKFRWMYGDKVDVPLVIRTPMGGRRGYGPTHSQSLEKHFMGVPGLAVVAVNPLVDPGALLTAAVLQDRRPLLFVENKTMYARRVLPMVDSKIGSMEARKSGVIYPTTTLCFGRFDGADATIVAYGGMVEMALEAAERLLIEDEIYVEVVAPTAIHPLDMDPIVASVRRTGRLVVCEEASVEAGFGAEVSSRINEEAFDALQAGVIRVGARAIPIGNAPQLEQAILPAVGDLIASVRALNIGRGRPARASLG